MIKTRVLFYPRVPNRSVLDLSVKAPTLEVLKATSPVKPMHQDPPYHPVPPIVGHRSLSNTEKAVKGNKYYQITLMRGMIGLPQSTRKIVRTLGLTKRHQIVWQPITSSVAGMILKLKELVRVELVHNIPSKKTVPVGYIKIGNALGTF
jgi:large subunit ribosomal protein L30